MLSYSIELIITVAVKAELPIEWLRDRHLRIHTLAAVKAGVLKSKPETHINSGMICIITGVGPRASRETAKWISANLQPFMVLNIGTAANLNKDHEIGNWVIPNRLIGEGESGEYRPDYPLPFQWLLDQTQFLEGTLCSLWQPLIGERTIDADYVDMEATFQALTFSQAKISFLALKFLTDYGNRSAEVSYQQQLKEMHQQLMVILAFLSPATDADIGVVIPVYNRNESLAVALRSVASQTLAASEIIVVDDGSAPKADSLLQAQFPQVTFLTLDRNRGVSYARNRGIEALKSHWIALLDSDDIWEKDKLERQWRYHQATPWYRLNQCEEIWIRDGVRVNRHKHHHKPHGWVWEPSLERCLISPSAVMLERAIFTEFNAFTEELPACEDYDLWLRLSRQLPVGLDPCPGLIKYGGHPDQLSQLYPAMDRFRLYSLIKALQQEKSDLYRDSLQKIIVKKAQVLLKGAIKRENFTLAAHLEQLLGQFLRQSPDIHKISKPQWLLDNTPLTPCV